MVVHGNAGLSAVGMAGRPGQPPGADPDAQVQRGSGRFLTVVRATVVVLLLNFDQFPRLIGRGFLLTAVVLAVPMVLNEVFRPVSRARVVVCCVLLTFGVLALPGIIEWPQAEYGQEKLLFLVTLTLVATLAVAVLRGKRDVDMFAVVLVVSGVVLALAALIGNSADGRSSGFGSNPIWLARAIGASLVALTWLYLRKHVSAWWAGGLGVLLFLGLFATGSRGPLLATVVALFVLVLAGLRLKVRRSRREWAGVGLMGALVLTVVALPSLLPPRVYALVVDPSEELYGSARADMREVTMSIIADHPGGVGYGNWGEYAEMPLLRYPHNLWLELPAEAGWLVGGAFVLAAVAVATGLWRATRRDPAAGFVLALLAFYAVAVSSSGDINGNRPLFVVLALGVLVLAGARSRTVLRRSSVDVGWQQHAAPPPFPVRTRGDTASRREIGPSRASG